MLKDKNWLDHFGAGTMIGAIPQKLRDPAEETTPVQMLIRVDEAQR